jgi:hypothetical protein
MLFMLLSAGVLAACQSQPGSQPASKETAMNPIAADVREYIASDEDMTRLSILGQHAGLEQRLQTPETRRSLVAYLATEEAWSTREAGFTNKVIHFLHDGFSEAEAPAIRPFVLHTDPYVRLRTYEYLVMLYFPDRNRPALLMTLQNMLVDEAEPVRVAGVRYLERSGALGDFRGFLQQWVRHYSGMGMQLESVELAERLLK